MSLSSRAKPAFFSAFLKAVKLQKKGLLETAIKYFTVALAAAAEDAHLFKAECCWNLGACASEEGLFEDAATYYYEAGLQFQKVENASRAIEAFSRAIEALELQEETEHLQLQIAQCSYDILQLLKKDKDKNKNWKLIAEHLLKINYVAPQTVESLEGFRLAEACQDAADQFLLDDQFEEAVAYYNAAKDFYDYESRMLKVEECEKSIEGAMFLQQSTYEEAVAMLKGASNKWTDHSLSPRTTLSGVPSTLFSAGSGSESEGPYHLHEVSRNSISRSQ